MLYGLTVDLHELTNLASMDNYREVSDGPKAKLIRKMVEAGEAAPALEKAETGRPDNAK